MSRILFDIEADGLLDTISRVWLVLTIDLDTKEFKYYPEGDLAWISVFDHAELLVGHNILGYDFPALKKIFGWEPKIGTRIHDTMILSQAQNYRRFENDRHSLEAWGEYLGFPKLSHDDFSKFSPEMLTYGERDVRLNERVYQFLMKEFTSLNKKNPNFKLSIQNEHMVAKFVARCAERGWKFDVERAIEVSAHMAADMASTEEIINPKLKLRTVPVDMCKGEVEVKYPRWNNDGSYWHHTAKWFHIDPDTGLDDDRLVEGEYCRVEFVQPTMKNMEDVKKYLYSIGWDPDDWTYERTENGGFIKKSPKLTEASLKAVGPDGELINDYTTTKSRFGVLRNWLEAVDDRGYLHGRIRTIGTPTGRATHAIVANVPGAEAKWGKEVRSLFIASPGKVIIGADSSGNQFRALCHYLNNPKYTELVLSGDVHQENANTLTAILQEAGIYGPGEVVSRKTAKPFIYAFLFGAGGEKLALIVLGKRDRRIGNLLKDKFIERVPGLKELVDNISAIYRKTEKVGKPWIPCIDGRRIYCDSLHKALNYLLQSFEAISCKAAVAYMMKKMDEDGVPYEPLIWYHDEFEIEVDECYKERALEISVEAYRESGKPFGMMILDGAGKIGNNWYEVH